MSLFGDDDDHVDQPSRPRPKQSSSLFDDEPKHANTSSNSLFADDSFGDDSPWSFPTPKKAARGSLVKSLLPASDVPESYIDAFDALLESDKSAGNNVPLSAARKLLGGSELPDEAQSRILDIVSQPGQEGAGLGRNEFNVLFALIGLAQEGEDITLDSVDERKRSESASIGDERPLTALRRQTCPYQTSNCRRRQLRRKLELQHRRIHSHLQRRPSDHPRRLLSNDSSSPYSRRRPRHRDRKRPCGNSLSAFRRQIPGRVRTCTEAITTLATPVCRLRLRRTA